MLSESERHLGRGRPRFYKFLYRRMKDTIQRFFAFRGPDKFSAFRGPDKLAGGKGRRLKMIGCQVSVKSQSIVRKDGISGWLCIPG